MKPLSILSLIPLVLALGCAHEPEQFFVLQKEATLFFEAHGDSISELADTLEADDAIQSLECTKGMGMQLPRKAISRVDGSTVELTREQVQKYRGLVKAAHVCDGGAVRGGIVFDLFETSGPTERQVIQLLRVSRDGDQLCARDGELFDGDWCVVPLSDGWQLAYSWSVIW